MIDKLSNVSQVNSRQISAEKRGAKANGFGDILRQELDKTQHGTKDVAFSKHAISRAEERGIDITPDLIDQLRGSMVRAQAKGAKNILAMDAEKAFIINVPNGKVITAITQDEMKENVFTNIDGAVFL